MTIYTLWKAAKTVVAHTIVGGIVVFVLWAVAISVFLQQVFGFFAFLVVMVWAVIEVMSTW